MESGYAYPERSANDSSLRSRSQQSHSKPATSHNLMKQERWKSHVRTKDAMLEWRSDQEVYEAGDNNRNTLANYLYEDKPEAESKTQEELSPITQPTKTTPGRKFFF